ncbi:MAG: MFS transporter [Desulfuromonadales bacterium]|nr:MFS transporter [Desulfuromonadales bacterium]
MLQGISGNVLILGMVSFLTDVSSEMIYPLLPLFVATLPGGSAAFLGLIEGAAETTASLLKLLSGTWSDRTGNRKGLVLAGYGLSSIARPLIALAVSPLGVLLVRMSDRVGKGVRTSPRDALIADSSPSDGHGKAFGFHRSMDHAGAVVGPLLATAALYFWVNDLRTVFWLAGIPGILAVILIILKVREVPREPSPLATARKLLPGSLPRGPIRGYLAILLIFTLGNSSDAFLLLKASQAGMSASRVALLWTSFHVVKMLATMPFGAFSDRIGRKRVIICGWGVYALAYAGFALADSQWQIWCVFLFYGIFYGLTEGVEKALVADLALVGQSGTAFGWYNLAIGVGALPASLIFGAIWTWASPAAAFTFGAGLAAVAALLLTMLPVPTNTAAQEIQHA